MAVDGGESGFPRNRPRPLLVLFTWHKNAGFQPHGLPMFNSEFVLYGRKGSAEFIDLKDFKTCFNAPRREHSRKPREFYDTVRRTCPPPRIDIFSREPRDGFEQFGNEIMKFAEPTRPTATGEG